MRQSARGTDGPCATRVLMARAPLGIDGPCAAGELTAREPPRELTVTAREPLGELTARAPLGDWRPGCYSGSGGP